MYADLAQNVRNSSLAHGSVTTRKRNGKSYLYVVSKDGSARVERYIGPADDPNTQHEADELRNAAKLAKALRATVSTLKRARIPAPTLVLGRILEVIANAGLFERGIVLVGTAAYQTYAPMLGVYLPSSLLTTNDVDFSLAEFVGSEPAQDIEAILKRADPTFAPNWKSRDKLPSMFRSANGFTVDLLTRYGRGRKSPVQFESLNCAAEALSFQEYLTQDTIESVALYGTGVLVRVPTPERFAVHKLIVAQKRKKNQAAKRRKDLRQAQELIDVFLETDPDLLQDTLDDARDRGRIWKSAINASLRELGRDVRHGHPPQPTKPAKKKATKRKAKRKPASKKMARKKTK